MVRIVAFVPCKGTSSRVESKNTKLLDSKPLFLHTLEKLLFECPFIDKVVLDSESDDVFKVAEFLASDNPKLVFLKRDEALATNKTDGNTLFMNEVERFDAEIYVQALCTSPFIHPETIKKGVESVMSGVYDSACTVRDDKLYTWTKAGPSYDIQNIPNSVDLPTTTVETMGLYIITRDAAKLTRRRIGNKPHMLHVTPEEAVDINYEVDFALANNIALAHRVAGLSRLRCAKLHLTSAILSDTLDDMGISGRVVFGLKPQGALSKLFGRACTLKLRPLRESEDLRGIYGALKSYNYVGDGDVIVVENPMKGRAYFGDLNAHIAITRGAAGFVTNGFTRDTVEVKCSNFPVYAAGSTCSDVRGVATVESTNQCISLDGVSCCPGDLIFSDQEGTLIIPRRFGNIVIEEALKRVFSESSIRQDILNGSSVSEIVARHGSF